VLGEQLTITKIRKPITVLKRCAVQKQDNVRKPNTFKNEPLSAPLTGRTAAK